MRALVTGGQAGDADAAAVERGDSWDGLMGRAGRALATGVLAELRASTGGVYGRRVLLVVGKGDNGGDGWVAAARLRERGVASTVLAVHGVGIGTSEHSTRARSAWLDSGGAVLDGLDDGARLERVVAAADVVVDAVLGTGIRGAPREPAAAAIDLCLRAEAPVVSCDVPSGVEADTGQVAAQAVRAARTVTFGAVKRGLALHPGAEHAGLVDVAGLGPRWHVPDDVDWRMTDDEHDGRPLPFDVDDDKTTRGRVLLVAGSERYAGAAVLSAAAAVRSGAGLVTLVTTAPRAPVLSLEPGAMVVRVPAVDPSEDDHAGGPSPDAVPTVLDLAGSVDTVVVGPGCGHGRGTRAVVDALLGADVSLVLDADAINVFRGDADALRRRGPGEGRPFVLTPHHRELGRLAGVDGDEAAARRHVLVPGLARRTGAVVVGKGPGTVVGSPGGAVTVVGAGGPALGTGGSGDVLAGMLGAALGRAAVTWSRLGGWWSEADEVDVAVPDTVHLHGLLGERTGRRSGTRATARLLVEDLPALLEARMRVTR